MVVHHAVGMTEPVVSFIDMLECVQEVDAVLVIFENGLLFIAAGGDVVDSTSVFYAEGAGHKGNLAKTKENVKLKDLTLQSSRHSHLAGQRKSKLRGYHTIIYFTLPVW
jgi:hypothetical protein